MNKYVTEKTSNTLKHTKDHINVNTMYKRKENSRTIFETFHPVFLAITYLNHLTFFGVEQIMDRYFAEHGESAMCLLREKRNRVDSYYDLYTI